MPESNPYTISRSGKKGIVTLPATLMVQVGLKVGDKVTWELRDNTLILRKAR